MNLESKQPPRPPNCFMIWSTEKRKEIAKNTNHKNNIDTSRAVAVAKSSATKIEPKVRKLSKKLLLVGATEAVDEPAKPSTSEKKKRTPKQDKPKQAKKLIIIESDEEE